MLVWMIKKMFGATVGKLSPEDRERLQSRMDKLLAEMVVAAAKNAAGGSAGSGYKFVDEEPGGPRWKGRI